MLTSVIIYCFNQLDQVKKIVSSIRNQDLMEGEAVNEIILADDGSTDGTREWAEQQGIMVAGKQDNKGFDIVANINEAAKMASGQYLLFLGGDTFIKDDFLRQALPYMKPSRLLNAPRFNVDFETDKIVSNDWRTKRLESVGKDPYADYVDLTTLLAEPWHMMQINAMVVPKKMWDELGGLYEGYSGEYGCCDTDFCMRAHYAGYKMGWATKAVAYHKDHPGKPDGENNAKLLEQRTIYYAKQAEQQTV